MVQDLDYIIKDIREVIDVLCAPNPAIGDTIWMMKGDELTNETVVDRLENVIGLLEAWK